MAKDVCKCSSCGYSLAHLVEEYDNQEKLPKDQKVFICPSCGLKSTFENYFSYSLIAVIFSLGVVIVVKTICFFLDGNCSSYENHISYALRFLLLLFVVLMLLGKRVPRLKVYKN